MRSLFRFNTNKDLTFLTDIQKNEEAIIEDTLGDYKPLMAYGIFRGTKLKVIRNDRWQEIILVEFDGKQIAIRKEDASPIKVQKVNDQ